MAISGSRYPCGLVPMSVRVKADIESNDSINKHTAKNKLAT